MLGLDVVIRCAKSPNRWSPNGPMETEGDKDELVFSVGSNEIISCKMCSVEGEAT